MNTEATFEAVKAAMEALEAEGKSVSLDAIKEITGGNKGTISRAREAVRAWRAAQSAEQAAPGAQDDDRVAEGVAKIVRPVAAHLAGIAPAVTEALNKELDAQRAASARATEAIHASHGRMATVRGSSARFDATASIMSSYLVSGIFDIYFDLTQTTTIKTGRICH